MKKFLLFLKIICFLMILIEILLLELPVVIGIFCLISPDFYINMYFKYYELFKLIIIVLLIFLFLIYLIILIFKKAMLPNFVINYV